jgi:hypothetical protein
VAELTWNTFRRHWILEYEVPKYEGDLGQPNLFVALSEAVLERKIALLLDGYPSQRAKPLLSPELIRGFARLRGVEANAETAFAEAFTCRKMTIRSPA